LNVIGGPFSSFFDELVYTLLNLDLVSVESSLAVKRDEVRLGGDGSFFSFSSLGLEKLLV
jgi:hypothetical protein